MSNNPIQNTSIIKASIVAIAVVLAAISIQPVKADSDKLTSNSLFNLTENLTTKVDYTKIKSESAPGWVKVSSKANQSNCQENVYSGQVLCENNPAPQAEIRNANLIPVLN
jgi:hypothetical protein